MGWFSTDGPVLGWLATGDRATTCLLLALGLVAGVTLVVFWGNVLHWLFGEPSLTPNFSPKGGCTNVLVREISRARREILVLAYSFSSKPVCEALVNARARGVHVQVVLDKSNEEEDFSALPILLQNGLTPLIDRQHAIAHNKVMLIDGHTLITGSFNFTHQAEAENAENLLVVKGHRELVRQYRKNFDLHKAHSQVPGKVAHAGHGTSRRAA